MSRKLMMLVVFCTGLVLSAMANPNCEAAFGPNAKLNPKQDEVNLPFVEDAQLQGHWVSVDFVDKIEDFNPSQKSFRGELFLQELTFLPEGKVVNSGFTWTKGHILHQGDKTDSAYEIKKINGQDYLFFEWKSGDYTCLGLTPSYYVLRKEADLRTDNINMPFKNDPKAVGQWKAIDFVTEPSQFKPGEKYWRGNLYLKTLTLQPNGKTPMSPAITWTKGHILHKGDKTNSAYEIKKIGGKEYMFFEWKSGDYVFRGQKPAYYVLEKIGK